MVHARFGSGAAGDGHFATSGLPSLSPTLKAPPTHFIEVAPPPAPPNHKQVQLVELLHFLAATDFLVRDGEADGCFRLLLSCPYAAAPAMPAVVAHHAAQAGVGLARGRAGRPGPGGGGGGGLGFSGLRVKDCRVLGF